MKHSKKDLGLEMMLIAIKSSICALVRLLASHVFTHCTKGNPHIFLQLCMLVPLYLSLHWSIDYSLSYLSYLTFPTQSSYDYIIIGAGSAGVATFEFH